MSRGGRGEIVIGLLLIAALLITTGLSAFAAPPKTINYQGYLTNKATGVPVGDPTPVVMSMTFRIYNVAVGGAALWTETQGSVPVANGLYNVVLGSVTALNIAFNEQYYLGVEIGTDGEMPARQQLTSVPYSIRANEADTVPDNAVTGSKIASGAVTDAKITGPISAVKLGAHSHSGADIVKGIVGELFIDAQVARDSEVTSAVSAHSANASAHHTRYTNAEAIAAVKAADGTGSTIDADFVDGKHASDFDNAVAAETSARTSADATLTANLNSEIIARQSGDISVTSSLSTHAANASAHHTRYTDAEAVTAVKNAGGAGSTIDADLLDGQHASAIIDAASDEVRTPVSSIPFTISSSGSYYLAGNFTLAAAATGITVNADNVTIDLMGFTLSCPGTMCSGTTTYGVYMNGRTNVEIRNGSVTGFGAGIYENSSLGKGGHRVINIRANGNYTHGIYLAGISHIVKDCSANNNSMTGIFAAGNGAIIIGNAVRDNLNDGIYTLSGSTIIDNNAYSNRQDGIHAGAYSIIDRNTAYNNSYSGIYPGIGSTITGNTASGNWRYGIDLYYGTSLVDRNTAVDNNRSAGAYTNIRTCATCTMGLNHAP